ncbi:LON peptidase substrate-binding domain-containing protein [Photobacterium rosenbergii]|uniref:LON peptidase substrate-binding domain-containing protein n=1 Tax=Photobacterium rosenbergii TaxID=294936 RepID=A0ABU3ZDV2_9GAMM|nr:LON peptidase substrate-binding domain-containing protein [Photobacterium rosenbergii]MDV5168285.1 LON peptidase substrate-binding domain-containing protein [Photobacterium rosenbergii]
MQLPLFPLQIYLLPGGISKLRIFEPRYTRLVKLAMGDGNGFGLCMKDEDSLCHFGTRVIITDFEKLPDGLLGITIRGVEKFLINKHWQEDDGLRFGDVTPMSNWTPSEIKFVDRDISNSLKALFEEYPEHAENYPLPDYNDMTWVCQRWLELLPLETNQKQWFMSRNDHRAALSFLHNVIDEQLKSDS